jgi:protein O-GlcNAc transferase
VQPQAARGRVTCKVKQPAQQVSASHTRDFTTQNYFISYGYHHQPSSLFIKQQTMLHGTFLHRRRAIVLLAVAVLFLLLTIYSLQSQARFRDYLPEWRLPGVGFAQDDTHSQNALDLPPEYNLEPYNTPFCAERFGREYLERLRNSFTGYCTPDSASNLTCFHSHMASDSRIDTFCIGRSAVFDFTDRKFSLGCNLRALTPNETSASIPEFSALRSYWYDTGPRTVFDKVVKMDANLAVPSTTANYTILIKREGAFNVWHCLMEIWSLTMSLDVLRMVIEPNEDAPFFVASDAENTQILILDDLENGPYFDLWTLFAKRPVIRLNDISEDTNIENIIVPLPGASNPLWQGDWDIHACERSELLRTFTHRVLDFYQIDAWAPHSGDLVLTYVDRKESRRLADHVSYFEELKATIPHVKVQIIDFAAISFKEQLQIIHETDVLVGVHGAGLTHGMFLREGSVMVEILPPDLTHKGFRNLAGVMGHTYLSTHATKPPETNSKDGNWHTEDVFLEKDRFIDLMEVAIKTLYNKGLRNYDVN